MKTNQLQKNIPNGWQTKSFNDCFDVASKLQGLKKSDYKEEGKYPIIDQAQGFITGYTDDNSLLQDKIPTIIFGDHTRILKYIDFPYVLGNDGTKIIWAKKENDPRFLFYSLLQLEIPNTGYNRHFKYLEQARINVPLKPEQEKISEILSKVDEDIEKTEQIIEETEKLKNGLMKELLTKGKKIQIKDISEINPEQIIPKEEIEYSYIDIASIDDFQVNNPKSFLGKNAPSRARRLVKTNDVIISTVRPNLKAFSYIKPNYNNFLCSTGFCVLRINNKLANSKYLYYSILQDSFVEYLVGKTTGSNYPAVSSSDIGEYILNLPSLDEQEKIAEILSGIDEKILVNKKLKEKLTQLKKGLMSDLLSGKVRTL